MRPKLPASGGKFENGNFHSSETLISSIMMYNKYILGVKPRLILGKFWPGAWILRGAGDPVDQWTNGLST